MKKIILLAFVCVIHNMNAGALPILTSSTTWKAAATTTDWNTPANWTSGVPTGAVDAVINGGNTNDPVIPSPTSAAVNKLTLTGGTLIINSGAGLTVNSDVNNAGTITVKSGGRIGRASCRERVCQYV